MCDLIGLGIGLFFLLIGGFFYYFNSKDEPKFLKLISLFSFEGVAILLGLLITLISILSILGIGTGTCESEFLN